MMSRDVHRLATRFDFFRLMAFYHSGELVLLSFGVRVLVLRTLKAPEGVLACEPDSATARKPQAKFGKYKPAWRRMQAS